MVSFWPFKSSEDAASFEKTLSTLTGKITRAAARNDQMRQRSRRVRVMWTLWAGFAYIFAALFWSLVVGYRKWGRTEYSAIAGGPLLIYIVRTSMTRYYDYRISSTETYLKNLTKERDATIERLKEATKYNSTQQLLEKYGNSPKQKKPASPPDKKAEDGQKPSGPAGPRTGIAPPPTANIQRPSDQQRPTSPQSPVSAVSSSQGPPPPQALPPPQSPSAEFAPNAFSAADLTYQYSSASAATFTQTHWYDRILDALLGEDETQPKNRLALICSECRLVNGQAPPGARTLDDVGRWRCGGCRAWNGKEKVEEVAVERLVKGWEEERRVRDREGGMGSDGGFDEDAGEAEDDAVPVGGEDGAEETSVSERTTRSKSKGRGKK